MWDLTAGKLLHDFQHEDSITGLEFHPSEFVLATSSADRTVKWWDLETSELIDTAGPEVTGQHQAGPTSPCMTAVTDLSAAVCSIFCLNIWMSGFSY